MPKTITIRGIDDELYLELADRARGLGVTLPELIRQLAASVAARQVMDEKLAALAGEEDG
jgi:hypothetical protein